MAERGGLLIRLGRIDQALGFLRGANAQKPDHPAIMAHLATAMTLANDFAGAEAILVLAANNRPASWRLTELAHLAMVRQRLKRNAVLHLFWRFSPARDVGEIRVLTECFPRVHVAQVHLDERDRNPQQCIAQGDTGVRVGRRIDHDERNSLGLRCMYALDKRMFGIALEARQGVAEACGVGAGASFDFGERQIPVACRLPLTEKVQVRTVQQQDGSHLCAGFQMFVMNTPRQGVFRGGQRAAGGR
jgi:hypothetical protein